MDPQALSFMAMRVALEEQKEVKRQMEESLRADFVAFVDKVKERTMLTTKKQDMLAEEAANAKMIDEYMGFFGAVATGDLETVQTFDEQAMMITLLTMMKSDGGDNGGPAGLYGGDLNIIGLGLEENATIEAIVGTVKTDGGCGGDSERFAGEYGDDVPKLKLGTEEKATMDTTVTMVKSDGNSGGGEGEFAGDYDEEGATVAAIEGTNSIDGIEA